MKVGLLLAAGLSKRFNGQNKLLAPLRGEPLVAYAANTLRLLELDHLVAVTGTADVDAHLDGFETVRHPHPEQGQGTSLALGTHAAAKREANRLLILLADMPFVTVAHCREVLTRCTDISASASLLGERTMPPACFPAQMFNQLRERKGSHGARDLVAALPASALVQANAHTLADIDTPGDLESHQNDAD